MADFYKELEEECKLKRKRKKIISAAQEKLNKRRLSAMRRIEDIKMRKELGIDFE